MSHPGEDGKNGNCNETVACQLKNASIRKFIAKRLLFVSFRFTPPREIFIYFGWRGGFVFDTFVTFVKWLETQLAQKPLSLSAKWDS